MDIQPLSPKARLVLAHPSPSIEAYEGAVRSSKTITSLLDWVRFVRTGPAGALAMCGKTERTVINNLILPLQEMLGPSRVRINYGTGVVTICGREVHVYGANNEQARTKIQGATLAGAYADEASTMPESFVQMLYSRLSVPGAKLWLTANPEGPSHWLKTGWLDRAKLWIDKHGNVKVNNGPNVMDLHRYTFVLEDNPALPPEYVERIKRSYVGLWRRRYIEAEWVMAAGAIYDSWDPATHVVPWVGLPRITRYVGIGVDYGTTNPTVAILLGLGADGCWYAVDEWAHVPATTGRKSTDAELSAGLRAWITQPHTPGDAPDTLGRIYVDPAAASFREQLKRDGLATIPAANDVVPGIQRVASLLAAGRLKASDRCRTLISEFPGYVWDTKATDKGEDKPVKLNDHALDGLRYIVAATARYTIT